MHESDIEFISHCLNGRVHDVEKMIGTLSLSNESLLRIHEALNKLINLSKEELKERNYSSLEINDYLIIFQMIIERTPVLELLRILEIQKDTKK